MVKTLISDQKPYRLFQCSKCFQYQYYLPTQKSKKCLRCGKLYSVSDLKPIEEVLGMSAAVSRVKELQNQISSNPPRFIAPSEFFIVNKAKKSEPENYSKQILNQSSVDEEEHEFIKALCLLRKACTRFTSFPYYITYIILHRIGLTSKKVNYVLRRAEKESKISKFVKNNTTYFRFNNDIQNGIK